MRWIIRLALALVVLVALAVGMLFLLPTERIGQIASEQLEHMTGRKLQLSGNFSPTLYPVLGIKTGSIAITNADWAQNPVMIEARSASVGVSLAALLGGNLEVQKVELVDPVIRLERAVDGRVNWEFGDAQKGASEGVSDTSGFSLELGQIVNGTVDFRDLQSGEALTVSQINARISLPKISGALSVAGSARLEGQDFNVTTNVTDFKALLSGSIAKIETQLEIKGAILGVTGNLGLGSDTPTLDGQVSVSLNDLSFIEQLSVDFPPQSPAIRDINAKGTVQFSAAGMFVDSNVSLQLGGLPIQATIELTGDENWQQNLALDTDLAIRADKTLSLEFTGRMNSPKALLAGKLDMKSGNPRRLITALGTPLEMPDGTFQNFAAAGNLRVSKKGDIVLKKARVVVDGNQLSGRIKVVNKGKPFVTATLSGGDLDFSKFVSDDNDAAAGNGAAGWSKEPIGLNGLDQVNAEIALTAKSVNLGVAKLGLVDITARLRDGFLSLRLNDVRAFQGAMSGAISLRGGDQLSFDSDVLAKDMQLRPLLGQLLDIDQLTGSGTTRLKLSGRGRSIHGVMNTLSGTGDIKFANGAFRGVDLAAMMNNLKSAFGGFEGATEFTSMTGSFVLKKGVLENVDLSLVSPLFKAGGKGRVNIGEQSMAYVVTPSTLNGGAEVSVPVIITGPWSNLKFRPDLEKLIDLVLQGKLKNNAKVQEAKEKLDKARAKLRDPKKLAKEKLRKKLGGEQEVKEKLEQKIEDEIGNALKKLFD